MIYNKENVKNTLKNIGCSKEIHDAANVRLDSIVKSNNVELLSSVNDKLFAKGYPESLFYVSDYYNMLSKNSLNNKHCIFKLKNDRMVTSLIYAPLFLDNNFDDQEVVSLLGVESGAWIEILQEYKSIIENKNITALIDQKINAVCVELYDRISNYISSNIKCGDVTVKFSMLDYFSSTNIDPEMFRLFLKRAKRNTLNNPNSKNRLISMMTGAMDYSYVITSASELAQYNFKYSYKGNTVVLDEEFSQELLDLFNAYNVKPYKNLLFEAAIRYGKGIPVFPLAESSNLESENNKKRQRTK